eukprot:evm.model.scf_375EXC.5 EVM.evm.TU.scf_375EXC.5   scf_375EXC:66480-68313(+)
MRPMIRCLGAALRSQELPSLRMCIWVERSAGDAPGIRVWDALPMRQASSAASVPSVEGREAAAAPHLRPVVDVRRLLSPDTWKGSTVGRLLAEAGASEEDLTKIHEKNPFVFVASDTEGLRGVIRWLGDAVGMEGGEIPAIIAKFPTMLSEPADVLEARVAWLQGKMGLERGEELKMLMLANPQVVGGQFQQRFGEALEFLGKMKIRGEDIRAMAAAYPMFLTFATEDRLHTFCKLMWKVLELRVSTTAGVLRKEPRALSRSVESLNEKLRYLMKLGMRRVDVAKLVVAHPQVLGYGLETMIQPTVAWLEEMGLRKKHICEAALARPQLLGLKVDGKIKANYQFLQLRLGFTRREIQMMLKVCPALVTKGLQDGTVEAKLRFLTEGLKRNIRELIQFPHYLTYSLQDRLIPRPMYLLSQKMKEARRYSLEKMYLDSDARFCNKLKIDVEAYRAYRERWLSTDGPKMWFEARGTGGDLRGESAGSIDSGAVGAAPHEAGDSSDHCVTEGTAALAESTS